MIKEIQEHRSVRKFKNDPIAPEVMERMLMAASRASNTGNMQVYSIIVTTDEETKQQLAPCHFNQPMVTQAPAVITFCADINRFSLWCRQREAEPGYDNFLWFVNGSIDALLASQNFALAAEHEGLGICYLGTTVYNAKKIIEILDLPKGVIPVTTVVVGHPAELPGLTDRLPLEAVVHYGKYHNYSPQDIDRIWKERETSEETAKLLEINQTDNLAKIFVEKRYTAKDSEAISKSYLEVLKEQGFLNHCK